MKHAVLAFALFTIPASLFAQGSLTPPGAPAPTMKSLDQLEARTPITSVPYTISSPGSYYLSSNLTVTSGSAITITASQVTLDLNGFTISSTAASANGTGILLAGGNADITILNGHIKGSVIYSGGGYSGPGFANGIYFSGSSPKNVRVSGVSVSGCSGYGIYLTLGDSTVVESCTVRTVGSYGIQANSVLRSTANQCGSVAMIAYIASDCYASSTGSQGFSAALSANNCYGLGSGSGIGLYAANAINCGGSSGSGQGLYAVTANNCQGQSGSGTGLYATQTATGCYGYSANDNGLVVIVANNCIGQCNGSSYGLFVYQIATGCYGSSVSGVGLSANIANSCFSSSGDFNIAHPYNMP